jgi:hypothetical protein
VHCHFVSPTDGGVEEQMAEAISTESIQIGDPSGLMGLCELELR